MFTTRFGKSGIPATVTAVCLLLAACGTGDDPSAAAEAEAARDTVDAMSREHAEDTTEPSPAAEIEPTRSVLSEPRMPYAEVGDENAYGYFAAPSDVYEPLPALIVIHEWWGLNDNVRAMADRLAGEGYMVLAVDLYGGKTADSPEEARQLMLGVVEDMDAARANIRGAYQFLEATGAPRIASLGWCFGGGWSLNTALLFPQELDAAVIYYGQVTDDESILAPLEVPILGLFGENDRGIRVDAVRAFETALGNLGKEFDIRVYDGVGHAFANPTGNNYNASVAEQAWVRTLEFLDKHLSAEGD